MAGIYSPIVTNYPNGVVTAISNTGTSYEQILNSMGSFVYGIDSMYVQSNNIEQVLQPLKFSQYDVNGTLQSYTQVTAVDPFQYQSSINFDLSKKDVVLQGRTTLDTELLSNERLNIILYVNEISNKNLLGGEDIFTQDDFYKDYSTEINDEVITETPKSVVEDIKSIIDSSVKTGGATINISEDLTVSNKQDTQVVSTTQSITKSSNIKFTPTIRPKATISENKKENPTYWMYVVIGSALVVGYLFKKIK